MNKMTEAEFKKWVSDHKETASTDTELVGTCSNCIQGSYHDCINEEEI